jgi:hypothetical protein
MVGRILAEILLATVLNGSGMAVVQGIMAPGAGPIDRAMARASTAAPVDLDSSFWNPANLSGLEQQGFLLSTKLLIPSTQLERAVPAGAIKFGFGPVYANASFLSVNPMRSYRATDDFSIGLGPVITAGSMSLNPGFFAPGPEGRIGLGDLPGGDQRPALLGRRVSDRRALRGERRLELRLLVQAPRVARVLVVQFRVSEPFGTPKRANP